jgi:heme/copper-type cytochrome/quinol oxidase subunit 3
VVATFLVVAAGVMLFAGLLGSYGAARSAAMARGETWLPDTVLLPNVAIAVTYLSLAMSSVTAQWSVAAIVAGARTQMYLAVGLTLVLGAAFVNGLTFVWQRLGLGAGDGDFATWMYALTVTHLLVLVAAMVLFVVLGFRALGGQFSSTDRQFVDCAAAFWHFAVVSGAAIWIAIWFMEGKPT